MDVEPSQDLFQVENLNVDNSVTKTVFALLKVAIIGEASECVSQADFPLTEEKWEAIRELSVKQGVCGIISDGFEYFPFRPPKPVLMKWLGRTVSIELLYDHHYQVASKLTSLWRREGIDTMIFKGLALSRYYPDPRHREFGDFDCYQFGKIEDGNLVAAKAGAKVNFGWYKHSKISYNGLTVENHKFFTNVRQGGKERKIERYLKNLVGDGSALNRMANSDILLPPPEFEGLYLVYHSFRHFLFEGITLRHFCDWSCWVKANRDKVDWKQLYEKCCEFDLGRFMEVLDDVRVRYLGGRSVSCPQPALSLTEKVLEYTLSTDTGIYAKSYGVWKERIKVIHSIVSNSWKYREFTEQGMISFLYGLVSGFISRSECDNS